MSVYHEEATKVLVDAILSAKDREKQLERFLIESVQNVYQTNARTHTEFLKIATNMGRLHSLYAECYYNAQDAQVLQTTKTFTVIDKVCLVIAKKRKRIITSSGITIIRANPSITRSAYFGTEKFVSMSIARSVEDTMFMNKWRELNQIVLTLTNRLKILKVTLQCMMNVVLFASDCESESEVIPTLKRGNERVITAVREFSESDSVWGLKETIKFLLLNRFKA